MGASIELINDAVLRDIIHAGLDGNAIRGGAIFAVEQTKFLIGKLLFLGHHILGQLQQRILITPEQLTHRDLYEGFDLQNVHNTGHGQAKESARRESNEQGQVWMLDS